MRRVVKLGGSLLSRPNLVSDLSAWVSKQPSAETLFIVGGGELIDAIRKLDAARPGDSTTVHWRCVDLLQTTFAYMCDWFPDWATIGTQQDWHIALQAGFAIDQPTLIAVNAFYRPTQDFDLPKDWRTTTDAIAAGLAIEASADELVLLKSCNVDASQSIDELASASIVDLSLPLIADQVHAIRVERLPTS